MNLTLTETIEQLHEALTEYIEATYHISNPKLIMQRKALLNEIGVIHQKPFLESTPRYKTKLTFSEISGLHPSIKEVFSIVSRKENGGDILIHDPPYHHQAESVQGCLVDKKNLLVMTGTGSGKTECFLLPILGKLAVEASTQPKVFYEQNAMRAIILYPMNALVNDQLGRLRLLFGDPRIVKHFTRWANRPPRFARYTSRTPYPGVRSAQKDQTRHKSFGEYYVQKLIIANDKTHEEQQRALKLINTLKQHGRWPAKPDLVKWFGVSGSRWQDPKTLLYKRCVTLKEDSELLTRHEVQEMPPDVVVTNYSMLEYMLMRPIERPIFDQTRAWLKANRKEKLILVIDEAHLYRGAPGAEVALLIRRLQERLEIEGDQMQIICTSASFQDPDSATTFASQLTGANESSFKIIEGQLNLREPEGWGNQQDADILSSVNLEDFYEAETDNKRLECIDRLVKYRNVNPEPESQKMLYYALRDFPPMNRLINITMQQAQSLDGLAGKIFKDIDEITSARALTTLVALGSTARLEANQPSLLPCRVHVFYRGLPGIWACMDQNCSELLPEEQEGPLGKLYSQPRDVCRCGARVLELFTCRNCGTAYVRAYTDNLEDPSYLWSEPGGILRTITGEISGLRALDILVEDPSSFDNIVVADYDLVTGRLNPPELGPRSRSVYLRKDRQQNIDEEPKAEPKIDRLGEFIPCATCGDRASFNRSSVQDHQTKGDQPFQALITKQIQVQPPSSIKASKLAPLRGRKVLVFSDSRQVAARLAPNLQSYSTQDTLRPLIVWGFKKLLEKNQIIKILSLSDLYFAVLLGACQLGARLRPEVKAHETFHIGEVEEAIEQGKIEDDQELFELLLNLRQCQPPESLLRSIMKTVLDPYLGLEALALACIIERRGLTQELVNLPNIPEIASNDEEKLSLARAWIRCWRKQGFWLQCVPSGWWCKEVKGHTGKFLSIERLLKDTQSKRIFNNGWLPQLLKRFTEQVEDKRRLKGNELSMMIGGKWGYCQSCRSVHTPLINKKICLDCQKETLQVIDPDHDPVFASRKGYYRSSTMAALFGSETPMAFIAAEHTAQLNVAGDRDVFSKAEENELLFQDVDLGQEKPAIDILSCTTTMEVGIDIGALSGVALRNMPPGRANYQQRSGRAGRRGNSVATVVAFGSSDSHDEYYFSHPDLMIKGPVNDPILTLDNYQIIRRHITACLLQKYYQEKLPDIRPEEQPHLFAVLGKVDDFKKSESILNRYDFELWLCRHEDKLKAEISKWVPKELNLQDHETLLRNLISETLEAIDDAIA